MYSFGVLVWEIFREGGVPYSDLQVTEIVSMVSLGHRLSRPSISTPQGFVELIWECTQMQVNKRLSMQSIKMWLEKVVRKEISGDKFVAVDVQPNEGNHYSEMEDEEESEL